MTRHPDPAREAAIRDFLETCGWGGAARADLAGDASTRRYERLTLDGRPAVLMDWPAGPDAPPAADGGDDAKHAYSAIAHLAENVRPFVAVDNYLTGLGLTAPDIIASDLDRGFLLLEDLGDAVLGDILDQGMGPEGEPLDEIYRASIELLVRLQAEGAPESLPINEGGGDGSAHELPHFDDGLLRAELDVPLDWYFPVVLGREASAAQREEFHALWTDLWPLMQAGPRALCLRDFHSPNILWLSGQKGLKRVGLIDFQDAFLGSRAYDVVSLLQDARKTVPAEREEVMLDFYVACAKDTLPGFDEEAFRAAYAVFGAERGLRLIGLWPRLLKRDGKPHYMAHMPRTKSYLRRNLAHPALGDLKRWIDANLPLDD
ncbi:phosphotransferase [uncultured Parvibaculum sp.]|uniref:aminoglycoside phosphotransferase family protein n=1 Tax=uncultured Parvibaculum sp. TaxID=291828 RepID=UPI0030D8A7DB